MVEKIITWLLERAGVMQRIAQLEAQVEQLAALPISVGESEPGRKKLTPADIINEWLNGGVHND